MLLDEYNKDKDDGYVSAKTYYLLHTNPEQYGEYAIYWFSDGVPNMGAFRRRLRQFKPSQAAGPDGELPSSMGARPVGVAEA